MNFTNTACVLVSCAAAIGACKKDEGKSEAPSTVAPVTEAPGTDKPEPPKAAWTGEDTVKTFNECWAAFNAKEEEKFSDCYAADAEFSYVDFAPAMTIKGAEGIAAVTKMWWKSFPDASGDAQLLLVNENNYAGIILMSQTNTGEGMMPPSGKKTISFEAQVGSLNADGKIATDHHHADQATMAHQMGMQASDMAPDSETPWSEKIVAIAKNDDKEKANIALIKSLGPFVDKQDADGLLANVTDDISFRYVGDKKVVSNKVEFAAALKEYFGMVKVKSRNERTTWAAGDWVVMVSDVTGEMAMDMPMAEGKKPEKTKGKEVKTTLTEFFQVSEGKVKSHWIFENTMQYAIQLGFVDPAKMGAHPEAKK
jgi:predicted ester cyclase